MRILLSFRNPQYFDYVYHNVGDSLEITSNGKKQKMNDDAGRYQASAKLPWVYHKTYRHPGWHYFEQVKTAPLSTKSYEATFTAKKLADNPIVMRALIPGGLDSEITQVKAPESKSAPPPYDKKPLPTMLIRRKGEAWSNPFVALYESHTEQAGETPAVQSVERLMQGDLFKGVKVTVNMAGKTVTQYVLVQESLEDEYVNTDLGIRFQGQFAVITLDENQSLSEAYIGSGKALTYKDQTVAADSKTFAAYKK